jgi:hypothetical protein
MAVMRIHAAPLAGLLAAYLCILPLSGAAAPYSVRLGMERIALDALTGFSDTTDLASPRLQDLAQSLTSPSNRVLLFALTDGDLLRFTQGDQLDKKKRYMLAATPKALERERVSPDAFKTFASEAQRDMGKPEEVKDLVKFLSGRPIGAATLLAELRRDASAITLMQATRLPPLAGKTFLDRDTPQYLLFTTTFTLVRGKALILTVYTLYDEPADMDWLKDVSRRWPDELQRLNSR